MEKESTKFGYRENINKRGTTLTSDQKDLRHNYKV